MRSLAALLAAVVAAPAAGADQRFETRLGGETEVNVILVEHPGFPIVNLHFHFQTGPVFDPPEKEGLTALTNRMLMRGTTKRGRAELEEAIEALGTEMHTVTRGEAVSVGGTVLRRNLEAFVTLLAEVLTAPAFDAGEIDKVRREMAAELEAAKDDDGTLAARWFRRSLFCGHPFGQTANGTAVTLARITREDVLDHYRRYYARANLVISASGDVKRAELERLLAAGFDALPVGTAVDWTFAEPPPPKGRHVILVDKADRSQTQILFGHPSIHATDPDYYALQIATTAFGGTFTARLMDEVRVKRGWSYGAYARMGVERAGGYYALQAAPSTEYADQTLALMFDEYSKVVHEGLRDDEIEFARGYLVNAFAFAVETPAARAAQRLRAYLLGRPDDWLDTYIERVSGVAPDAVRDAVKRRLDPDNLVVVMVCTAPPMRDKIAALPGVTTVEVVPYAEER